MNKIALMAYTAGLVDGEGSIQINEGRGQNSGKRYFGLTVQVSGNDGDTLKWLHKRWGIGSVTKWKARGGKRTSYNWRIYAKEAELFLSRVRPFIRMKREQIEIALKFRRYVKPCGLGNKKGIPPKWLEKRRALAEKMRELNLKNGKSCRRVRFGDRVR